MWFQSDTGRLWNLSLATRIYIVRYDRDWCLNAVFLPNNIDAVTLCSYDSEEDAQAALQNVAHFLSRDHKLINTTLIQPIRGL